MLVYVGAAQKRSSGQHKRRKNPGSRGTRKHSNSKKTRRLRQKKMTFFFFELGGYIYPAPNESPEFPSLVCGPGDHFSRRCSRRGDGNYGSRGVRKHPNSKTKRRSRRKRETTRFFSEIGMLPDPTREPYLPPLVRPGRPLSRRSSTARRGTADVVVVSIGCLTARAASSRRRGGTCEESGSCG